MPLVLLTGAARADSIAAVAAFLLSPAGRWVSGQLLRSDGGFSARY